MKMVSELDTICFLRKRQYGFLSGLLAKSGVNWNPITKKVDCTHESWDEASKAYDTMKNKKDGAWPFYEDWVEAIGDYSTDFVEAIMKYRITMGILATINRRWPKRSFWTTVT